MMNVNRRVFLKQGALAYVCMGMGPFWGPRFLRETAFAADLGSSTDNKILICIFQRGAVDGLSMVVPYGDPSYYQNRSDIAIGAPSQAAGANAALDLDDPNAVLNQCVNVLLQDNITDSTRKVLTESALPTPGENKTVDPTKLIALIIGSPEFQRK